MSQVVDELLIEEAKHDPEAFGELVLRYQDRLYNFLYRMTGNAQDAEDLAQEVFLRIYKALDRFRPDAPFRPWMYKIAVNTAINHIKGRKPVTVLEDYIPSRSMDDCPEEMAETREAQRLITKSILELPEAYRAIVLLRHIDDLPYDEIAHALDLPLGTVKVRLHRARALLQSKLLAAGIKNVGDHELQRSNETTAPLSR